MVIFVLPSTAPISARQQIASAIHIVVTFNFRFGTHYGRKSDIAPCPKRAMNRHRDPSHQKKKPPEGGSQIKPADRRSGGHQCWL
jgi:hypothetical protein